MQGSEAETIAVPGADRTAHRDLVESDLTPSVTASGEDLAPEMTKVVPEAFREEVAEQIKHRNNPICAVDPSPSLELDQTSPNLRACVLLEWLRGRRVHVLSFRDPDKWVDRDKP